MTVTVAGITGGIPYETLSVTLAIGEIRAISKTSNYLSVLSQTGSTSVSFNGSSFFPLPPGIAISDFSVDEIWVQNTSGALNTVLIATGTATLRDNRLVIDTTNPLPVTIAGNQATNVTQFGGSAIATGVGASGVGIPRVTLANDSVLAANQSVNVNQVGGTAITAAGGTMPVGSVQSHSGALTQNPHMIGGRVFTSIDTSVASGDASACAVSTSLQLITKPYGIPETDWNYVPPAAGITNSAVAVTAKAAAGAGLRNYITNCQLMAEALGAATEFIINEAGSGTVFWRIKIPLGGLPACNFDFLSPLRFGANLAIEIKTVTASVTGSVYCNLQGSVGQ